MRAFERVRADYSAESLALFRSGYEQHPEEEPADMRPEGYAS